MTQMLVTVPWQWQTHPAAVFVHQLTYRLL